MPLLLIYYLSNCLLVITDKNNGWDFKNSGIKVVLSLKYSLWGDSLSWKSLIWGGTATTPAPEAVGLIVVCGKAGALMETSTKQLSHYRPAKLSAECEHTMRKWSSSVALVPIVWGSLGFLCHLQTNLNTSVHEVRPELQRPNQAPSLSFVEGKRYSFLSFLKFLQIFYFSCGRKKKKSMWPASPCCWLDLAFDPRRANDNPRL